MIKSSQITIESFGIRTTPKFIEFSEIFNALISIAFKNECPVIAISFQP